VDFHNPGHDGQGRYGDHEAGAANRSPRELGTFVKKGSEVQYHHEVYNQSLWQQILAQALGLLQP